MEATQAMDSIVEEYSREGEKRPLAAYAGLTAGYAGAVVVCACAARLTGRKLPRKVPLTDLLLMGVATHKTARLLALDRVTSFIRAPFTRFDHDISSAEVMEKPRGRGVRYAVGELITCPFCSAQWVVTGFFLSYVFAPRFTKYVASVMAALTISDFAQQAWGAATKAGS